MVNSTAMTGQTGAQPIINSQQQSDRAVLGEDFDAFLALLTTQLKNQDPLSPMDTHEFTAQLVQFSQVEQSIKSNEHLEALVDLQRGSEIHTAAALTGKMVEVDGSRSQFDPLEGPMRYVLDVPGGLSEMDIEIVNTAGQVVSRMGAQPTAGRREMSWDGSTIAGGMAPPGNYTVRAVGKQGADGEMQNVPTSVIGRVDGATIDGGEIMLEIAGGQVPISALKSFRSI